jgi:hypothetical protein
MSFKPRIDENLRRLRQIIGALPDTSEKISHGAPTWWGGKRTFAALHDGHYDNGEPAIWIKAAPGVQEELVAADPERFYRPKYFGPSGWVALRLRPTTDWGEVEALLISGYDLAC